MKKITMIMLMLISGVVVVEAGVVEASENSSIQHSLALFAEFRL